MLFNDPARASAMFRMTKKRKNINKPRKSFDKRDIDSKVWCWVEGIDFINYEGLSWRWRRKNRRRPSSATDSCEIDFPRSTRRIFLGKTFAVFFQKLRCWLASILLPEGCLKRYLRLLDDKFNWRSRFPRGQTAEGFKIFTRVELSVTENFKVVCWHSWNMVQSKPDCIPFNLNLLLFENNLMLDLMSPGV